MSNFSDNKSYEYFFMNFANKTKLNIILCLKNKPMSVNEIAGKINEEQSNVSHHLKNLALCQIVNARQKGKKRIYSLNKETVVPMLNLVEKHAHKNCPNECSKKCMGCK